MTDILFLSHTDIRSDSRILKSMLVALDSNLSVYGIGISQVDGSAISSDEVKEKTIAVKLFSRKLFFIPKMIRHVISVVELTFKVFPKSLKAKPKIVHCNDTIVLPLSILIKIFTKCKIIYDAHELESDRNGLSKIGGRMTLLVEKLSWSFIDSLITVSPSINKWYMDNIGPKNSLVILNSPLLKEISENKSNYLRDCFQIKDQTKIFIYIGILTKGRGINLILNYFENTKLNAAAVFLGYGEMNKEILKKSKENNNIFIHEAVTHKNVVNIAKSADFGICLIENISLSDYYSLPNKLFEYTFSGLPIIASNFPDISKVVKEYELAECVDVDLGSFSKSMDDIIIKQKNYSFNPKRLQPLSWSAQAKLLSDLYSKNLNIDQHL